VRKRLLRRVEETRVRDGELGTSPQDGMQGAFFPVVNSVRLKVLASDGRDWKECGLPGVPWEHVSVSLPDRCPTWDEMDAVKRLFWDDSETVVQFHVARSEHINTHDYCLHLWRRSDGRIPQPPKKCV